MLEFCVMLANCPAAGRKRQAKSISSACLLKWGFFSDTFWVLVLGKVNGCVEKHGRDLGVLFVF